MGRQGCVEAERGEWLEDEHGKAPYFILSDNTLSECRIVQSLIKPIQRELARIFLPVLQLFGDVSVYTVCPSSLSLNNFKAYKK